MFTIFIYWPAIVRIDWRREAYIDHNTLTVSGEKQAEKEDKGRHYYRVERSYGNFQRSITLPEGTDENKIDASFKRGVLKISLPKTAKYQKQSKRIQVKTG